MGYTVKGVLLVFTQGAPTCDVIKRLPGRAFTNTKEHWQWPDRIC